MLAVICCLMRNGWRASLWPFERRYTDHFESRWTIKTGTAPGVRSFWPTLRGIEMALALWTAVLLRCVLGSCRPSHEP